MIERCYHGLFSSEACRDGSRALQLMIKDEFVESISYSFVPIDH